MAVREADEIALWNMIEERGSDTRSLIVVDRKDRFYSYRQSWICDQVVGCPDPRDTCLYHEVIRLLH